MPIANRRQQPSPLTAAIAAAIQQRGDGQYLTTKDSCNCPDHRYRHRVCKHMLALRDASLLTSDTFNQSADDMKRIADLYNLF